MVKESRFPSPFREQREGQTAPVFSVKISTITSSFGPMVFSEKDKKNSGNRKKKGGPHTSHRFQDKWGVNNQRAKKKFSTHHTSQNRPQPNEKMTKRTTKKRREGYLIRKKRPSGNNAKGSRAFYLR